MALPRPRPRLYSNSDDWDWYPEYDEKIVAKIKDEIFSSSEIEGESEDVSPGVEDQDVSPEVKDVPPREKLDDVLGDVR